MRTIILGLCVMMLTGCADSLKTYDQGSMLLQEHHIPPTWSKPGHTDYARCRPEQAVWSVKWSQKVCPGTVDKDAYLAVQDDAVSSPSYASMSIPGASAAVPIAAGVGTGLALSGGSVSQNAAASQSVQQPGPWRGGYGHR